MEEGISDSRDSDRFRRSHGGIQQNVQTHRSRSGLDGLATAVVGRAGEVVTSSNRSFYKMSGSGNDFVFFDLSEGPADDLETPTAVRAISARGTGVGADGVVFLRPHRNDEISIRYYNSD